MFAVTTGMVAVGMNASEVILPLGSYGLLLRCLLFLVATDSEQCETKAKERTEICLLF